MRCVAGLFGIFEVLVLRFDDVVSGRAVVRQSARTSELRAGHGLHWISSVTWPVLCHAAGCGAA
ncbi:Uncharacterised protein [Mycobacteroides abscessus subsp. abscessus]|nr:Uncharacterised protein [Mycobacteroides abscessus subsp. abscessus]